MRKSLCGIFLIIAAGCFCGASFSIAADMEDPANALNLAIPATTDGAIADKNYIINLYASAGTAEDSPAARVFSAGSNVYFHIYYYMATTGTVARYYIIGNAAGSLAYFTAFSENLTTTGNKYKYLSVSTLPPGTYFFTIGITMPDNNMVSPTPYWFVIE